MQKNYLSANDFSFFFFLQCAQVEERQFKTNICKVKNQLESEN